MVWRTLRAFARKRARSKRPRPDPLSAVVVVRSYREVNLSIKQGGQALYVRATLEWVSGDPALQQHARDGLLKVGGERSALAKVTELPWVEGTTLMVAGHPRGEGMFDVVSVRTHTG